MSTPEIVHQIQQDIEAGTSKPDYESAMKRYADKWRAAEKECRRLRAALQAIAEQRLGCEMDDHTAFHADWEEGYEGIVMVARKALNPQNS